MNLLKLVTSSLTVKLKVALDGNEPEAIDVDTHEYDPVDDELGFLLGSYFRAWVLNVIIVILIAKTMQEFLSSWIGHVKIRSFDSL